MTLTPTPNQVVTNATDDLLTSALVLRGPRPRRWKVAGERKELVLHGFWDFWWRDMFVSNVTAVPQPDGTHRVDVSHTKTGTVLPNSSFYVVNVLEVRLCLFLHSYMLLCALRALSRPLSLSACAALNLYPLSARLLLFDHRAIRSVCVCSVTHPLCIGICLSTSACVCPSRS
jgi:hypothetical protein